MKQVTTNRGVCTVAALTGGALYSPLSSDAQTAAKLLGDKQLAELIASAKTAADHRELAAHYRAVAANHEAEATEHAELAAKYKANPTISDMKRPGAPDTASHRLAYAEPCRKAAKTMSDMAAMHEEMAKNIK